MVHQRGCVMGRRTALELSPPPGGPETTAFGDVRTVVAADALQALVRRAGSYVHQGTADALLAANQRNGKPNPNLQHNPVFEVNEVKPLEVADRKLFKRWSGRRDSNPRRPAWEA